MDSVCALKSQPYRNKHTPNLYPVTGDDCRLTYSNPNRAVQLRVGFELAEKAGLGFQSSAGGLGFCRTFLEQALYYAKCSAERSCRTPKIPQTFREPLECWARLLRTGFFSSQDRVHAKGVVLCERTCFCLLSTF